MIEPASKMRELSSKPSKQNIEDSFQQFNQKLWSNIKSKAMEGYKDYWYHFSQKISPQNLEVFIKMTKKELERFENKGYKAFIITSGNDSLSIKLYITWDLDAIFKDIVNNYINSNENSSKVIYVTGHKDFSI